MMHVYAEEVHPDDVITVVNTETDEGFMLYVEKVVLMSNSVEIHGVTLYEDTHHVLSPVPFGWEVEVCNA